MDASLYKNIIFRTVAIVTLALVTVALISLSRICTDFIKASTWTSSAETVPATFRSSRLEKSCKPTKNAYIEEHLQTAASESYLKVTSATKLFFTIK